MSSPHFYQAEEKFVEAVFGMKPDKQQHQTAIDVNPVGAQISLSHPQPSSFLLQAGAGGKTFPLPLGGAVLYSSKRACWLRYLARGCHHR